MREEKPRKVVFIDRHFQGAFILKFLLLLLVGTGLFVLAAYVILDRRLEETYYSAHYTIKSTGEMLLPTLLALSAVFVVVLGAAVIAVTLYVSHHISGPLFAIRRYLESIARGELDFQPKLRLDDQTTALTESLAQALETLNTRLISIHRGADEVRAASARLPQHLKALDVSTADCRRDLEALLAREDALIRDLDFFRLRTPSEKP
ncbi:MAG TPA: methyl-accepting chemotaxis protein [Candidatus Methanoperedens sp.]|nr:methyl-accepting chemotaxis protein [Candidatus Methanoperedens sp.]